MATILGSADTAWVKVAPDAAGFGPDARAKVTAAVKGLSASVPLTVDSRMFAASVAAAGTSLEGLRAQGAKVSAQLSGLRASVDTVAAEAKIAALQVRAQSLNRALASAGPGADLLKLSSQLLNVQAAAEKAAAGLDDAGHAAGSVNSGLASWARLGSAIGNITSIHIPLFATAMHVADDETNVFNKGLTNLGSNFITSASGAHLALESLVEFTAVWAPASLAVALFGAAAIPTVLQIGQQLKNMTVTSKATGQQFDTLKTSGAGLVSAIKPEVMQLFGEALLAASNNSGQLTKALSAVGTVLDNFGAEIDKALSSNAASKFLSSASGDVQGLGVAFTQVGRIIGTLLSAVPGYAAILLKLGDAALTGAADIVQASQPIIKAFLAIHGAVFYLGLATTLVGTFGKSAVQAFGQVASGGDKVTETGNKLSGFGAAIGNAAGGLVQFGSKAKGYTSALGDIAKESGPAQAGSVLLGDALDLVPFGPAGIAAGLLGAAIGGVLYFALKNTTPAVTAFNNSMAKMIAASNVVNIQQNIAKAAEATTAEIAKLTAANTANAASYAAAAGAAQVDAGQLHNLHQAQQEGAQAVAQQNTQLMAYANLNATAAIRLNTLGKSYGDTTSVMQLMTLAGVKQSDVANANAAAWQLDQIKIQATAQAYDLMGQQAGAVGNQLDTLTISTGTVTKAVQTLTQAEQGWLSLITGGDSAFTGFEQGMSTLKAAMDGGSASGVKLTTTSGKLKDGITLVGTALNGTSDSALAARQAFDSQVTSAGQLFGNLQLLAAASGNTTSAQTQLTAAGKDLVAQLLPMAAGSKTATAEVSALAQLAGGPATTNLKTLQTWVGNTKNAEGDLNSQTQSLTVSSLSLTDAAKNLAGALSGQVASAQATALLGTTKFQSAQNTLIDTMRTSKGALTDAATAASVNYYNALVQAGNSTTSAKDDVNALLIKLGAVPGTVSQVDAALASIPRQVNVSVVESLTTVSSASASQAAQAAVLAPPKFSGGLIGAARGMVVPGSSSSVTHDNHLALVKSGELIIPSQHAPKFRDMARKASVPGFASGGPVSDGSFRVSAPYSYGSGSGYATPAATLAEALAAGSGGSDQLGRIVLQNILAEMRAQTQMMRAQPRQMAGAVNGGATHGLNRAYWATGG